MGERTGKGGMKQGGMGAGDMGAAGVEAEGSRGHMITGARWEEPTRGWASCAPSHTGTRLLLTLLLLTSLAHAQLLMEGGYHPHGRVMQTGVYVCVWGG